MKPTDEPDAPAWGQLRDGLTLDALQEAVEKSGYPLQSTIFQLLEQDFRVQQEWGFRDRLSGEMRSIDLVARRELEHTPPQESRIRPTLTVMIECKQSNLPYVFFSTSPAPWKLDLPTICGLGIKEVVVTTDDNPSSWHFSVSEALDLTLHPFHKVEGFSIVSKCARKGPRLELSGIDAYNGIVMPLISAATHFIEASRPPTTAHWFDAYLVCAVAVVDAPMIVATNNSSGVKLEARPWCRLFRHEPKDLGEFLGEAGRHLAVDVVHKDFAAQYFTDHLLPFAEYFREGALRNHEVLATGEGFIEGHEFNPESLRDFLKPKAGHGS
ncbi:hypothetical protein Srubr_66010 [Streptomyces rubradiris]|uniref:Restriction endonuclease n=2 Tax=Streptomyces rubradiris TaxID=285531 RepID=A0ABQ3RLM3_STRRR|nr:hypothetical protein GCM10018792_32800 [Streptomyces rubradiris]GHI56755.1 hypothetical protein Srubr_66010 [Streptomyces rubradiris]